MPTFLITAHDQPSLLRRLVQRLAPHKVFVHLNKLVSPAEFEEVLDDIPHVTLIPRRDSIATAWGGFSLVRAQLLLMDAAMNSIGNQDYFITLTGRDYPIKPIDQFEDYLSSNMGREHIGYFQITNSMPKYSTFIDKLFFYDQVARMGGDIGSFRLIRRALNKGINGRLPKPKRFSAYRKQNIIVCGYPRFALSKEIVNAVLEKDVEPAVNFFKYGHAPDDMFFHSLIANSLSNSNAIPGMIKYTDNDSQSLKQAIPEFFCKEHFQFIIEDQAIQHLSNCSSFFARKFCINQSKDVLDTLDRMAGVELD